MLGIEDRICSSDDNFIDTYKKMRPINYTEVDAILSNERVLSEEFLMDSLRDKID